jgi:hypothetical protein
LEPQEHWQAELQKVKERYDESSLHLRKMLEEQNQGLLPTPDGAFAVRQARMRESAARQEHMRVVNILNDIIKSDKRLDSGG